MSGTLTLLGGGRDVAAAVVYLEPLDVPRPALGLSVLAPGAVAGPTAAPRDSVRLLWGAVRDLGTVARDLRDRVAALRAGSSERLKAGTPATPGLAALDSAAGRAAPGAPAVAVAPPRAADSAEQSAARLAAAAAASRAEMLMRQKTFAPHVQVVPAGATVAWPNRDPFSHNVFSNTPGGGFDLGLYPRGESRGAAFRRAGVYAVFCNIHPRMSAYVVSVPSPYYARPDAEGRWAIADVPPGRYRVRAWHERASEQAGRVLAVGASGATAALTLDARGYREQPHANKFGQPYARAARDEY